MFLSSKCFEVCGVGVALEGLWSAVRTFSMARHANALHLAESRRSRRRSTHLLLFGIGFSLFRVPCSCILDLLHTAVVHCAGIVDRLVQLPLDESESVKGLLGVTDTRRTAQQRTLLQPPLEANISSPHCMHWLRPRLRSPGDTACARGRMQYRS